MKIKSRYTDTSNGYIKLYIPGIGVVGEHRWIMEQHLGRELSYNEVVHHRDGDKQNNALDNLEVIDRSSHARAHSPAGMPMAGLRCAYCGRTFASSRPTVMTKIRQGQKDFYCNRACMASAFGRGRSK